MGVIDYGAIQGDVSTTLTLTDIDTNYGYHEIGVTFYSDSTFNTVVDSGMTGTYGLKVIPSVNEYEQDVSGATAINIAIDTQLKTPITISTGISQIKVTPTAIAGATHWELRVRAEDNR